MSRLDREEGGIKCTGNLSAEIGGEKELNGALLGRGQPPMRSNKQLHGSRGCGNGRERKGWGPGVLAVFTGTCSSDPVEGTLWYLRYDVT
eukprot:759327-Hanusia_phi.AAC.5